MIEEEDKKQKPAEEEYLELKDALPEKEKEIKTANYEFFWCGGSQAEDFQILY